MSKARTLADRILDAALEEAETVGWSALRLRRVATRLNLARVVYRDKDAVADAWFARADAVMLTSRDQAFAARPARERIFEVIMSWLDAMEHHRAVTHQMLAEKLYLGHPHHNVALVLAVSRTVQWIREAALLDATGRRKQVEEIGLTALFLATVRRWTRDESPGQADTREFLARRLDRADRLMASLWPPRATP